MYRAGVQGAGSQGTEPEMGNDTRLAEERALLASLADDAGPPPQDWTFKA